MQRSEPPRPTQVLKTAVRLSRLSYRDIERRLDLHAGALSRLLNGEIELKMRHVERICEVIGLPPGRLLRVAYPIEDENDSARQMEEALTTLYPAARRTAAPSPGGGPGPLAAEEIEQRVLSALRTFFAELARPKAESASDAPAPRTGASVSSKG